MQDASSDEEVPEQAARQSLHQEQDSEDEEEAPAPTKRPASAKAPAKTAVDLAAEDSESEDDLLPRKKLATTAGKVIPVTSTPLPPHSSPYCKGLLSSFLFFERHSPSSTQ